MTLGWKEWKLSDILYGVVVPLIVAFVIIAFPVALRPTLNAIDPSHTLEAIFVYGVEEAVLIVAVPMLLGLVWNQWAGGASGFLLGCVYALTTFDIFGLQGDTNVFLLGYVMSGTLTGYIAGSLNKGSFSFLRMVISGLVAAVIGGLFLFITYKLPQPIDMATNIPYTLFITILPRIIFGIIVPIFAKVFSWYGVTPRHMS